ncbi:MAG: hypothetical protein GY801_17040 [bacterium]|nr:hypothetical protein [bacterium]
MNAYVSDGALSDTESFSITIDHVNRAPVAEAGTEQTVETGALIQLDGSASSDPDGDGLSFSWQFVSLPSESVLTENDITDRDTASPSFTPDVAGDYTLQLEVTDGQLNASDTVTIHAVRTVFTISGYIVDSDGLGIPGVMLNGFPESVITDSAGWYRAAIESGWSGTVIPQKEHYTFTPGEQSYEPVTTDFPEQHYTGILPQYTLDVEIDGDGSGFVTGDGGINCGTECSGSFAKDTTVYFSAIPDSGSIFDGCAGAECHAIGECWIIMTEDTTIAVTFSLEPVITPTPTGTSDPTPTPEPGVIPEPGALLLFVTGLLGLLGIGLRRWGRKD